MAHLQDIGLQGVQQQIPQQIPLPQRRHITHGNGRLHDLIQLLPAPGGHRLPPALGAAFLQIGPHHIGKGRGIFGAAQLLAGLGLVLLVDVAKEVPQHPAAAATEVREQVKQRLELREPGKQELLPGLLTQELPLLLPQGLQYFGYPFRWQRTQLGVQLVGIPAVLLTPGE
ncbi:hypothetical protein B5G34_05770 [Flavonifractor sp. An82]|nr:hypothetical protein B5G34_05770 [Flavonifractor sp. An82]